MQPIGLERAAFYKSLKSKVGLAAAKAAALRINLNVEGCGIVAAPVHAPSRAPPLLPLLSHTLPPPRPPLSPSPHANSLIIGTAVINTHTPKAPPSLEYGKETRTQGPRNNQSHARHHNRQDRGKVNSEPLSPSNEGRQITFFQGGGESRTTPGAQVS
jgi:hypothetical protein